MGIFGKLFKNKPAKLKDFSSLRVDMHSHLIPGIDDGAATMADSLTLIRRMSELGFEKLITTPHIQGEFFKNTPEIILSGLDKVREAVKNENIPIKIEAAAEYLIDDNFMEKFESKNLLTLMDKYLLIELSYYTPHPNLKEILFELQLAGYKIILAHPERYSYWFNNFKKYEELKDRDISFQLNTISISGYYSMQVKKIAKKLIENEMIDFLGSDMHNPTYMEGLEKSLDEKLLHKVLASGKIRNSTLI